MLAVCTKKYHSHRSLNDFRKCQGLELSVLIDVMLGTKQIRIPMIITSGISFSLFPRWVSGGQYLDADSSLLEEANDSDVLNHNGCEFTHFNAHRDKIRLFDIEFKLSSHKTAARNKTVVGFLPRPLPQTTRGTVKANLSKSFSTAAPGLLTWTDLLSAYSLTWPREVMIANTIPTSPL